jgi:putative transposase
MRLSISHIPTLHLMNDFNLLFDSLMDLARDKSQLLKENLFLRQQLIILRRSVKKLKIRKSDRLFLVLLRRFLSNWRECIYVVKPDTILRWHRSLGRSFWRWYSRKKARPRFRVPQETRCLVRHMASTTIWGAKRIEGELLKLGIKLGKTTILKLIRPFRRNHDPDRSQKWRTFLANHAPHIWAADFFTATTVGFRQIYVLVVLAVETRKIVHIAVTHHPGSEWTYRQILQATWEHPAPRFLVIDRDNKYGGGFASHLRNRLKIKAIRTPFRTPKANAFCERVIGSIRRECLDHFLIFGEKHLRRILAEYVQYYNEYRPHQGIGQGIPADDDLRSRSCVGKVCRRTILGGLHYHYYRKAA